MKPPAEMTRDDLVDEITYLRELAYGAPDAEAIDKLRLRLRVTPHEARLLLCLQRARPSRPVSKELIGQHMPLAHGHDRAEDANNVSVYVSRLRARFGRQIIETVGASHLFRGYRLTDAGRQVVAEALA
jgi:DNA-binding response OmpR family regulator